MSRPYEIVRYPGSPFAQTHPDRLSTMAALFGMTPPPIDGARVLEIGCCDGGNIIPMAAAMPKASFVGIDLTEIDIADAKATASALGLSNIEFHVMDLTALPGDLGQFDYVIAHGIYSWVPPAVREKLLAVVKASLVPNGVAFVSYNVFPGGHVRLIVREMMLYHSKGIDDPAQILTRSRELLEFLASLPGDVKGERNYFGNELGVMYRRPNWGLFHDELEENYNPVYFHEFAEHAARCDLRYLSEANYFEMYNPSMVNVLQKMMEGRGDDRLVAEQYFDFARLRNFRQTLLCHREAAVDTKVEHARLKSFLFSSPSRLQQSTDTVGGAGAQEFSSPNGSSLRTEDPTLLAIFHQLIEAWPQAVPFANLSAADSDPDNCCAALHALLAAGMVEAHLTPVRFTVAPGERPSATPLVRLQASRGLPLTSLRHFSVNTGGGLELRLISLLDGTRTRADLLRELAPHLQTDKTQDQLAAELDTTLTTLGKLCLLIS